MSTIRNIVFAVVYIGLAGCASVAQNNTPTPIFASPSSSQDVSGLINTSGSITCNPGNVRISDNSIPSEFSQFAVLSYCAYSQDFVVYQKAFVDKGITLSDQTCGVFFNELEAKRTGSSYLQTSANITGGAVTAVLAASTTHARALINTATLLTATNAWFEAYKSNFVLTPQLSKLQSKLQTNLRDPLAVQMKAKAGTGGYSTFDDAKRDLLKYDQLCSHQVLMEIVTESVATAELEPFDPVPSSVKVTKALSLIQAIYDVGSKNGAGIYDKGDFESLYTVAVMASNKEERVVFSNLLKKLRPRLAPHIDELKLDGDIDPAILEKFEYAGELQGLSTSGFVLELVTKFRDLAKSNKLVADAELALAQFKVREAADFKANAVPNKSFKSMAETSKEQNLLNDLLAERAKVVGAVITLLRFAPPSLTLAPRTISFGYRINRSNAKN